MRLAGRCDLATWLAQARIVTTNGSLDGMSRRKVCRGESFRQRQPTTHVVFFQNAEKSRQV